MALRATLLLVALLLFGISQVSSDPKIDQDELQKLSQAFHVFTKGANRRLMEDMVVRLSNYFKLGGSLVVAPAPAPHSSQLDCGGLCKHRCSLHSRPNLCIRACGTCCVRCKCVPPGTFGNRELCGNCYTNMTTHGNRTKCP